MWFKKRDRQLLEEMSRRVAQRPAEDLTISKANELALAQEVRRLREELIDSQMGAVNHCEEAILLRIDRLEGRMHEPTVEHIEVQPVEIDVAVPLERLYPNVAKVVAAKLPTTGPPEKAQRVRKPPAKKAPRKPRKRTT